MNKNDNEQSKDDILKFKKTVDESEDTPPWVEKVKKAKCPIDIYADAFIPTRRLDNPIPVTIPPDLTYYQAFEGDNRGFIKAGSARMWTDVIVDICAPQPLINKAHDTGVTRGFRYESVKVRDVPFYDLITPAYRVVEVSDTAKADTDDMNETITKEGDCKVKVKIDAAAGNPLITSAPDIDYHYEITLDCEQNGLISYQIKGSHDGFPAYSIFIGDVLVYSHDPLTTAQTPFSLWGFGEFKVNTSGTIRSR